MKRINWIVVATVGVMLLAACGSDPTPTATAAPTPTPTVATAATPTTPAATPTAAGPVTVEIGPTKDTTIYDEATLSNGSGEWIFAGKTRRGATRRALIVFDVAGEIPAGATIMEATLRLFVAQTTALDEPVALHSLLKDWGEGASDAEANEGRGIAAEPGDATWEGTGIGDAKWTTAGGDFEAEPTASILVGARGSSFDWGPDAALTAEVQRWLDDPASNFGWILVGNESSSRTAKRFDSRENFSGFPEPLPPVLTVTYSQ